MTRGRYVAAFVGQESATATFAGMSRINGWVALDHDGYENFPGNRELEELGMSGRTPDAPECLAFNLEPLDHYAEWVGRLVIDWPQPYQQWWRWGRAGTFRVRSIDEQSRFVRDMPEWHELALTWAELQNLPAPWRLALTHWRGVYLIYDTARLAGYVGSAYGDENILGRWRAYAVTGHGGNLALRASDPANLRFSILQRTSPDLEPAAVIALESSWKDRLHTRTFGLNRN